MKNKYKLLYNITIMIAWVLLVAAAVVGAEFRQLTAFWIIMAVLAVDVVLQIIFWNKF